MLLEGGQAAHLDPVTVRGQLSRKGGGAQPQLAAHPPSAAECYLRLLADLGARWSRGHAKAAAVPGDKGDDVGGKPSAPVVPRPRARGNNKAAARARTGAAGVRELARATE